MADSQGPSEQVRSQLREFRRVVSDAVGELRSQEVRDTYASITLVELMNQRVEELSGEDSIRKSRKQRLSALYKEFSEKIKSIKETDPSAFRVPDPARDVNTEK